MKGRFIARAFNKSGWLDFWKIEKYNDRPLGYGDLVINQYDLCNMKMLERVLKERKKYLTCVVKRRVVAYKRRRGDYARPRKQTKVIGL